MSDNTTPVEVLVALLGRVDDLGAAIGLDRKAGYVWRRPAARRKAGDLPSVDVVKKFKAYSDQHGLGLTLDHLIYGADQAELDRLLGKKVAA